jgi:hypothetical protein
LVCAFAFGNPIRVRRLGRWASIRSLIACQDPGGFGAKTDEAVNRLTDKRGHDPSENATNKPQEKAPQ